MNQDNSVNDELEEMVPVLEFTPTIRFRIWEIFFGLFISLFFMNLMKEIPINGLFLDSIVGLKIKLLHVKISYEILAWPCRIFSLLGFFYAVFVVLQQKMTQYQLNDLNLIHTHGVITRTSDSTDLVAIRDHTLKRSLSDRLLGLSRLCIISNDKTHPEFDIKGITAEQAQSVINFMRKYAYQNYTEFRLAQEKAKMRKNKSKQNLKNIKDLDIDDDIED